MYILYGATQSGSRTTRDATDDITKIYIVVEYLLSEGVTKEKKGSTGPGFEDPKLIGSRKVSQGRLDDYLKGDIELEQQDAINKCGEDEINYEIIL